MESLREIEKDPEWVGTVTKPKYECNYQVGTLVKWFRDTGASCHVIGTRGEL